MVFLGLCHAKLVDCWSGRVSLPQLVYFGKQTISKARLGHHKGPETQKIPGNNSKKKKNACGKIFNTGICTGITHNSPGDNSRKWGPFIEC